MNEWCVIGETEMYQEEGRAYLKSFCLLLSSPVPESQGRERE
jgi:hypothetical protein